MPMEMKRIMCYHYRSEMMMYNLHTYTTYIRMKIRPIVKLGHIAFLFSSFNILNFRNLTYLNLVRVDGTYYL